MFLSKLSCKSLIIKIVNSSQEMNCKNSNIKSISTSPTLTGEREEVAKRQQIKRTVKDNSFHWNQALVEIIDVIKLSLSRIGEHLNLLKLWIGFLIPKMKVRWHLLWRSFELIWWHCEKFNQLPSNWRLQAWKIGNEREFYQLKDIVRAHYIIF